MTHSRLLAMAAIAPLLAACAAPSTGRAPIVFDDGTNTTVRAGSGGTAAAPGQPDARGLVTYPTYQIVLAREGDTVASAAARVGADPAEVARYNGLDTTATLRASDPVVLPPRADRYGSTVASAAPQPGSPGWSPEIAAAAIARAGSGGGTPTATPAGNTPAATPVAFPTTAQQPRLSASTLPASTGAGGDPSVARDGIEPIRHTVGPGETLFSIARLYDVSVTSITEWNDLGASLVVAPGDVIYIPLRTGPSTAAAVPAPVVPTAASQPGTPTQAAPPPSAAAPLPETIAAATPPPSPALSQSEAASAGAVFVRPVDGPVLRPYSRASGPSGNDGIDFQATAGEGVRAADDGEVIFVSRSVTSFENMVLVRHPNDLVTSYSRLDRVNVARGDRVSRGQVLGEAAGGASPSVQFQVLRNMAPVDPAPFL